MRKYWPISEFLSNELGDVHLIRLTTPAHRNNSSLPEFLNNLSTQGVEFIDTPYIPKDVWEESESVAASYYDTAMTYYFPGGTSYAVIAGLHAAFSHNDNILVARNIHQSVLSALIMIDANLQWICPESPWFIYDAAQVEKALIDDPSITGVVLSNPSYEGHCSDIATIAKICKKYKTKLIVDESLGAHWIGWKAFPKSAIQHGADLVFHSLHKRVGSLVPASLLHVPKESVLDFGLIKQCAKIFRSTSPSNLVLASTEMCIMRHFTDAALSHAIDLVVFVNELRDETRTFQHESISSIPIECQEPLVVHFIPRRGCPAELADIMYNRGFDYEHVDTRGLIYFVSPQESSTSFASFRENFQKAIIDLVNQPSKLFCYVKPNIVMRPLDALRSHSQTILLSEQEIGRVSADLVGACPPGIPILMPGEEISSWHCSMLSEKRIRIVRDRL